MTRLNTIIKGLVLTLCLAAPAFAMQNLSDEDLEEITGQAGADLSLKMTWNHDADANFLCVDLVYCRLALNLNNRYHDGTQDAYDVGTGVRTPSLTGRKQWLVFKGIQGTINIPELKLDGEDVVYGSGSTVQASLKFGFTPTKPIEIRNFGFKSLAIETDTCTELNANCSVGVTNLPGYLTPATLYSAGGVTGFDADKEKGFLGLNVNANLSLTGSIKMFSCSSGHPRC